MLTKLENFKREEIQTIVNESTSISEVLRKIGYGRTGGWYNIEMSKYLKENGFNTSSILGRHIKRYDDTGIPKKWLSEILTKNSTGNSNSLKKRLIEYGVKEYRCENPKCGISSWCGEDIVLQLHHINGDHYDNRLENLVLLCPNCHSQTSNFTSKNSSDSLNSILEKIAIDEAKSGKENLLRFEETRKREIKENRIKQGKYTEEERKNLKRPVKRFCKQCGKIITGKGKIFCSLECMTQFQRERSGFSIEDIVKKAEKCKTLIELGKSFGVTDSAIKKRLKTSGEYERVKQTLAGNKKKKTS